MISDNKEIWIKAGYEIFAISGQEALKIEPLAKKVGKSKSSFYHFFADVEVFVEHLLKFHLIQSESIAKKEQNAATIDPDLINILVEHKIDLLFNRQLRINQNITAFSETLTSSNRIIGDSFVQVWIQDLGLQFSQKQLEAIFSLALENFFLQINTSNLNHPWLKAYFSNLKKVTKNLI
jgi:AcrR family transcriptional regulator